MSPVSSFRLLHYFSCPHRQYLRTPTLGRKNLLLRSTHSFGGTHSAPCRIEFLHLCLYVCCFLNLEDHIFLSPCSRPRSSSGCKLSGCLHLILSFLSLNSYYLSSPSLSTQSSYCFIRLSHFLSSEQRKLFLPCLLCLSQRRYDAENRENTECLLTDAHM